MCKPITKILALILVLSTFQANAVEPAADSVHQAGTGGTHIPEYRDKAMP